MSWYKVLILGVCVFSTQSTVLRRQDATLNRIVRSPHYGSSYHHDDFDLPPPPPHGPHAPPIVYHTQNWSGVAKGVGGAPQGVFSGAAASAQSAAPAISEAFSIAASEAGPVDSDDGGQVKENLKKSEFGSHSNYGASASHGSGSFGDKYGGASNGFASSGEGQYNIKAGLEFGGGVTGSGSEGSERQLGQFNTGAAGFDKKLAGGISTGYAGSSSGQFKSIGFDRETGQRSINSGFGGKSFGRESGAYGSHSQYGSSKAFGDTGNRGDIGSESLANGNSAGSASSEFDSQSGQHNLQTSNNGLATFNGQSDQFNAGSGFDSKSVSAAAASSNQFGQNNGQSSGSGYQRGGSNRGFEGHRGGYGAGREFESHRGGYGAGREFESHRGSYGAGGEFENHGGYGGGHSNHQGDIHRHGKSHRESYHFEQNGKQFGHQSSAGQGFGDDGQVRSTGFSNSHSSSFGSNRGNYGSGSSGSGAGYSGNLGQVEQSGKLDTGLTASHAGPEDFSGGQQVKQFDQLNAGFSASQAGSQGLSGGQTQLSSGASGYKSSGRFSSGNKEALQAGSVNGGLSQASEADGSFSADAGTSGHEDVQSTLGSALNLASQGLQAAQKTPCSTCNKGSYALSNAKSHSGSAIALSIGG